MAESDIKQRAVRCSDAVWGAIKARAEAADISVNEYVIACLTGADIAPTSETDAVALAPVPSVDTVPVLSDLTERMNERATAVGMTPDEWLRGLVQITLERPIPGVKTASKATPQTPSTKHLERDLASRFASLTHAPADSPNVKWAMHQEPGPPAWMTAPTTRPGMTRDQALGAGMEAARIVMGGKAA